MSPTAKLKILCVDDEVDVLDSLGRLLRHEFDVITAASSQEALSILESDPNFAIILSDYKMPEMSGIELLRHVKQICPTTVRAILSGQMDIQDISDAINRAEIHRFILKPWDNEYLKLQMLEAKQTHIRLIEKRKLEIQATTDPVTGLTNHRYFQNKLETLFESAVKNNTPLAIVMIDVDHFKSYNDRYGHPEGDRLLFNIGQRMLKYFAPPITLSRYGGEEFAIIIPGKTALEVKDKVEELRLDLEENPFPGPYEKEAYVTISLGVASYPDHKKSALFLLEAADRALYQAKHQGRNQTQLAYSSPT
ncbi:MAG: diguanylate cyclase [Bdellovibrionaceae bacterium]|nr:diguanylate cyclase [Pseudobdellovibrionaceae bacterium]